MNRTTTVGFCKNSDNCYSIAERRQKSSPPSESDKVRTRSRSIMNIMAMALQPNTPTQKKKSTYDFCCGYRRRLRASISDVPALCFISLFPSPSLELPLANSNLKFNAPPHQALKPAPLPVCRCGDSPVTAASLPSHAFAASPRLASPGAPGPGLQFVGVRYLPYSAPIATNRATQQKNQNATIERRERGGGCAAPPIPIPVHHHRSSKHHHYHPSSARHHASSAHSR